MTRRLAIFTYAALIYLAFLATFLYAIGFVTGLAVPWTVDSGAIGPIWQAILINLLLLGTFGIQHTIMARPGFKRWWTTIIPAEAERSTFVLVTCVIFVALFIFWRPLEGTVWTVEATWTRTLLWVLGFAGWGLVLYSTFLIDHFDLFGIRHAVLCLRGKAYTRPKFVKRAVYSHIRHPLMSGFMIAFWATPDMTASHLMFAIVTTAYIMVGTKVEERDLVAAHPEYVEYRNTVPAFVPGLKRSPTSDQPSAIGV